MLRTRVARRPSPPPSDRPPSSASNGSGLAVPGRCRRRGVGLAAARALSLVVPLVRPAAPGGAGDDTDADDGDAALR